VSGTESKELVRVPEAEKIVDEGSPNFYFLNDDVQNLQCVELLTRG